MDFSNVHVFKSIESLCTCTVLQIRLCYLGAGRKRRMALRYNTLKVSGASEGIITFFVFFQGTKRNYPVYKNYDMIIIL